MIFPCLPWQNIDKICFGVVLGPVDTNEDLTKTEVKNRVLRCIEVFFDHLEMSYFAQTFTLFAYCYSVNTP